MKILLNYTLTGLAVLILAASVANAAEAEPVLSDADCIKCHDELVRTVRGQESAHRDDIGCLDCHKSHPPDGVAVIPRCGMCHDPADMKHFTLQGCKRCHNPHAPVITDFTALEDVAPGCVTCHPQPGRDMKEFPSAHSDQDCNNCHTGHGLKEGKYNTCLDCHEKHADNLTLADCLACHGPHKPSAYIWTDKATASLCAACHEDIAGKFEKEGGAHLDNLRCIECHEKHPPNRDGVIPKCQKCHDPEENRHFSAEDCTKCHDPHAPMDFDLSKVKDVKPACATCHSGPVEEMKSKPSKHSQLDCNACHKVHGQYMECLECHKPHSEEMKYEDCLKCHKPHAPTLLEYGQDISAGLCAACHADEVSQLAENNTRHHELGCAYCHRNRHKSMLACEDCHGKPHNAEFHSRFEECNECHISPHALAR